MVYWRTHWCILSFNIPWKRWTDCLWINLRLNILMFDEEFHKGMTNLFFILSQFLLHSAQLESMYFPHFFFLRIGRWCFKCPFAKAPSCTRLFSLIRPFMPLQDTNHFLLISCVFVFHIISIFFVAWGKKHYSRYLALSLLTPLYRAAKRVWTLIEERPFYKIRVGTSFKGNLV